MKKRLLAFLLICSTLFSVTSCAFPGMMQNNTQNSSSSSRKKRDSSSKKDEDEDKDDSSDDYNFDERIETDTVAECQFESLYSDEKAIKLASGATQEFEIDEELGVREYVRLLLKSDSNLLGAFTYCDVKNTNHVVTEEFYIEPSNEEIEFRQFLDSFRHNGVGVYITDDETKEFEAFEKKLLSVSLKNLDAETANIAVYDIAVSNRAVPALNKEIYLVNGGLKVGADLAMGGTLSYLEKISYAGETIDEILSTDDEVLIGVGYKDGENVVSHLSSNVNLINIADAGREFQQSYYANVGGTTEEATGANGYERRISYTADANGYYWPYNPVQGGDEVCNLSQIIDYEVSSKEIYVKVRAMDWANGAARPEKRDENYEKVKNGRTTKSYIENWYTIRLGMLEATNRFIDWNGFTDMDSIGIHSLEIPAAYVVHPLSTYVCYKGNRAWDLNDKSYDKQPDLKDWVSAPHINQGKESHPEDWFAWVNDDDFGVGVYIPGAETFVSGRVVNMRNIAHAHNRSAYKSKMAQYYLFNKRYPESPYTSCYTENSCYTAPVVNVYMKEYVALSYTYVIAVDYLENFRANFKEYHDNASITNEGLKAWD